MKVVLVSGANRGIGFEVCRQLDALGFKVILCSRNIKNGTKVAVDLSKNVIVKQLDITDEKSIKALYLFVKQEFGKLDVLINNAALGASAQERMAVESVKRFIKNRLSTVYQITKKIKPVMGKSYTYNENIVPSNVNLVKARHLMETNLFGQWNMIQHFIPLLRKSEAANIINVSSGMGTINSLSGLYPAYSLSKSSLNALTIMLSKELVEQNIKVNAVCPGWVKTDMGGADAPKTVSEGADTIVWLANNNDTETGMFYQDRKIIEW